MIKLILASLMVLSIPSITWADGKCKAQMWEDMDDYSGMAEAKLVGTDKVKLNKNISFYQHWVRVSGCEKGYVIYEYRMVTCTPVQEPYTVGGCEISGMDAW